MQVCVHVLCSRSVEEKLSNMDSVMILDVDSATGADLKKLVRDAVPGFEKLAEYERELKTMRALRAKSSKG